MREVAFDTWAFLELYDQGPRCRDVAKLLRDADFVFTVRDVVGETCNYIIRRSGRTEDGWAWWEALASTPMRVFEPPLREVRDFLGDRDRRGGLSFTDHALAGVALRERVKEVATADDEFHRFGLTPLFARR